MKHVVFTYGRFNPPTLAHEALVTTLKKYAGQTGAKPRVYTTATEDADNPLPYETKRWWLTRIFGPIVQPISATIIQVMQTLQMEGFTHTTLVQGEDRLHEFKGLLERYRYQEFQMEEITYFQYGGSRGIYHFDYDYRQVRTPDKMAYISGSLTRECVRRDDYATFKLLVPDELVENEKLQLYFELRKAMENI